MFMTNEKNVERSEKFFARRNFLKWGVTAGLVALPIGLTLYRQMAKRKSFTFGFDRLPDDLNWLNDRSFDNIIQNLPESIHYFFPDSLLVSRRGACLSFFAEAKNSLEKTLAITGKLILNDNSVIEGALDFYDVQLPQKPYRASAPCGMIPPMILPTPNDYNIPFPSNVDVMSLKRVEWTVSTLG